MTLPPTTVALLRALRDAGGALPYYSPIAGQGDLWRASLVRIHTDGLVARIELTPAGRIEAARLAEEA